MNEAWLQDFVNNYCPSVFKNDHSETTYVIRQYVKY